MVHVKEYVDWGDETINFNFKAYSIYDWHVDICSSAALGIYINISKAFPLSLVILQDELHACVMKVLVCWVAYLWVSMSLLYKGELSCFPYLWFNIYRRPAFIENVSSYSLGKLGLKVQDDTYSSIDAADSKNTTDGPSEAIAWLMWLLCAWVPTRVQAREAGPGVTK